MSPRPIRLTVNGRRVEASVEPRTHLADFLRERLLLTGTHLGCEHGICGACTVSIDGEIARSCITYAVACDGAEVRTIEGFDDDPIMARLRRAFAEEHALQCGYCTPGMLIAARDIVRRLPGADDRRIRLELSGNLCRCTGYVGIVRAVRRAVDETPETERAEAQPRARQATPQPPLETPTPESAPREAAAARGERAAAPPAPGRLGEMTTIAQSFVVGHPRPAVWAFFRDVRALAGCMPGAEVTAVEGEQVAGRVAISVGPMSAAFAGEGRISREDAAFRGVVEGVGRDRRSATRARGRVHYRLLEADGGAATRVEVEVAFALAGPLAQFSRSGIVNDLAARLTQAFARNLEQRLDRGEAGAPAAPAKPASLGAGSLLASVILARIRGFFAKLLRRH